jgi:hypothetical protein
MHDDGDIGRPIHHVIDPPAQPPYPRGRRAAQIRQRYPNLPSDRVRAHLELGRSLRRHRFPWRALLLTLAASGILLYLVSR